MRAIRALTIGLALIVVLGACEMTVTFSTQLDDAGGGTFTLGMSIDEEVRRSLDLLASFTGDPADGIRSIEDLFAGLDAQGWDVEREEPDGGLAFSASRTFTDPDDFGRVLDELGSARESGGGTIGQTALELGVTAERSFFRDRTGVSGLVDLRLSDELPQDEELLGDLQRQIRFEVRTSFAGAIDEVEGPGAVSDAEVVWRPLFGERTTFAASASSVRIVPLLALLLPGLALLGVAGWFFIGRPRHSRDDDLVAIRTDVIVLDDDARDGVAGSAVEPPRT